MKQINLSVLVVPLLMCLAPVSAWAQPIIVSATYTAENGHQPASVAADRLNPERTIVEIHEGEQTVLHEVNFYFIREDGAEEVVRVTDYFYPLYQRFIEDPAGLEEYERVEVYYNGERGSEPFNTGSVELRFKDRPFLSEPIELTAPFSIEESAATVSIPLERVRGADFLWAEMEYQPGTEFQVSLTNPDQGSAQRVTGRRVVQAASVLSESTTTDGDAAPATGMLLDQPIGVGFPNRFTHVEIGLGLPSGSDRAGEGTLYAKTLSAAERQRVVRQDQAASAATDQARNVTIYLSVFAAVLGYVLVKFVYRRYMERSTQHPFVLSLLGNWVIRNLTILGWLLFVFLIWLTPLIPGRNLHVLLETEAFTFIPWLLFTFVPFQLDYKFNRCPKCKAYRTIEQAGAQDLGGTRTTYTRGNKQVGSEEHHYYSDLYVCTECGHETTRRYSTHSGGNGGGGDTDVIGVGGGSWLNFVISFVQPYRWYKFFRAIRLLA